MSFLSSTSSLRKTVRPVVKVTVGSAIALMLNAPSVLSYPNYEHKSHVAPTAKLNSAHTSNAGPFTKSKQLSLAEDPASSTKFQQTANHQAQFSKVLDLVTDRIIEEHNRPNSRFDTVNRLFDLASAYRLLGDSESVEKVIETADSLLLSVDEISKLQRRNNENYQVTTYLGETAKHHAMTGDISAAEKFIQLAFDSLDCPIDPYGACSKSSYKENFRENSKITAVSKAATASSTPMQFSKSQSVLQATLLSDLRRGSDFEYALMSIVDAYSEMNKVVPEAEATAPGLQQVFEIAYEAYSQSRYGLEYKAEGGVFEQIATVYSQLDDVNAAKAGLAQLKEHHRFAGLYSASIQSNLASIYRRMGDETTAQEILSSLLQQDRSKRSPEVTAQIVQNIAIAYGQMNDEQAVREGLSKLMTMIESIESVDLRQQAVIDVAIAHIHIGNDSTAQALLIPLLTNEQDVANLTREFSVIRNLLQENESVYTTYVPGAGMPQFADLQLSLNEIFSRVKDYPQELDADLAQANWTILEGSAKALREDVQRLIALGSVAYTMGEQGETERSQEIFAELLESTESH